MLGAILLLAGVILVLTLLIRKIKNPATGLSSYSTDSASGDDPSFFELGEFSSSHESGHHAGHDCGSHDGGFDGGGCDGGHH